MKRLINILIISVFIFSSCKEKIIIDTESGPQMTGIFSIISAKEETQTVKITRTMPFYSTDPTETVSNAIVYVFDSINHDTVQFFEGSTAGVYESEIPFAGIHNNTYYLDVTTFDDDDETNHFTASAHLLPNIKKIDSIRIKPYKLGEMDFENRMGVYPYFQSLKGDEIYYMGRLKKNDILLSDTITKCIVASMLGFSGLYFNGPIMTALAGEIAAYILNQKREDEKLHDGDKITLLVNTVTKEYAEYINDISSSNGSNPFLGIPSNVSSNIYPQDKGVGFFTAYSEVSFDYIYHEEKPK